MKRILAIIMAVLVLSTALAGCNKKTDDGASDATKNQSDVQDVDFGENVVAVAGDYEITLDDAKVYIDLIVPYIQQSTGADEGWENIVLGEGLTARDELINAAIDECRYQMAFVDYAKAEGIYSDEAAEAYFEQYITEIGGEEFFEEMLTEYGLNRDSIKKYIVYMGAYAAMLDAACTDEEADKIFNEEYITAKHILVLFEGRDSEDAAYDEAMAIYNKAIAGENFEDLIDEYNEDPGQDASAGYTFTIGTMVDEFYEGALALKTGEISEPVKTTYGYHIIKRYDNPGKDSVNYTDSIAAIKNAASSEIFTDTMYETIIADYPLTINESILSQIDLSIYTVPTVYDENVNYADGSVFNE